MIRQRLSSLTIAGLVMSIVLIITGCGAFPAAPASETETPAAQIIIPQNYAGAVASPSLWTELKPSGTLPSQRNCQASAYDAANDRLIIFGGKDSTHYFDDTWVLDGASGRDGTASWIPLAISGAAPPQRYSSLTGYNAAKNMLIVFGGSDSSSFIKMDLWVLSNANGLLGAASSWNKLEIQGTPPGARIRMAGGYDENNDTLIFFGGCSYLNSAMTLYNETWIIRNVTTNPSWQKLNIAGNVPPARRDAAAVYDAARNRLILYGGDTTLDLKDTTKRVNDTWILANANGSGTPEWNRVAAVGQPATLAGHTAAFDSAHNRMLIFGGTSNENYTQNNVWVLAEPGEKTSFWAEYDTGLPRPRAREFHTAAYTGNAANRLIVFGGHTGSSNLVNDVWLLNSANGLPATIVSNISVKAVATTLYTGYTLQLSAVAGDASGNQVNGVIYTWNSSNPAIATVSSTGLVKGISPGTVTITVCHGDISANISIKIIGEVAETITSTTNVTLTTSAVTTVPSPIRIASLGAGSAAPMSLLTVSGSGFDAAGDLRIRFSDKLGYSVDCFAIDVTATSLKVSVPPYLNLDTGDFASGTVAVQVVQDLQGAAIASNTVSGFQIEDLPYAEGETGDATLEYLTNISELIREEKRNLGLLEQLSGGKVSSPELAATMDNLQARYTAVREEVQSVLDNPDKSVVFAKLGDVDLVLNTAAIGYIDRLVTALKQQTISSEQAAAALSYNTGGDSQSNGFILLSSKKEQAGITLFDSDLKEYWLTLEGQQLSEIISKIKTWEGYTGTFLGYADYFNKIKFKNDAAGKFFNGSGKADAVFWVTTTGLPAAFTLYEDFSSISAATEKTTWDKIVSLDKQMLAATGKFAGTVGPGLFDVATGIPFFGTLDALWEIIGGDIRIVGENFISAANTANLVRAAAFESGTLPAVSGLNLIKSGSDNDSDSDNSAPSQLTGVWDGTMHILSTSRIQGGDEFGSQEATLKINLQLEQQGSNLTGWLRVMDEQQSILFDYTFYDYMKMIIPSVTEIAGEVDSNGSVQFTDFWRYSNVKVSGVGTAMKAEFDETFISDAEDLVIVKLPGQKSQNIIGYTETYDTVTLSLQRTGDLPPY